MASPSMDIVAVNGWQAPLVVKSVDETYGIIPPKSLSSMDIRPIHGWKDSMSGIQHVQVNEPLGRDQQ